LPGPLGGREHGARRSGLACGTMTVTPVGVAIMKPILFTFLFAAVGALLGDDDATTKDLAKFDGEWTVEKIEGRSPLKVEKLKVTFKGEKVSLEGLSDNMIKLTIKIDPSKKQKEIDIKTDFGTLNGIYEFDDKTLKVCYSELQESEKGKRPTDFTVGDGSFRYLWVLKKK
jgi:uncharacterized protein (TIGR03067 family)